MKARLLRQRLSVSAPRMTVRSHVPLAAKVAIGIVLLVAAIAAGGWFARSQIAHAAFGDANPEVARLRAENRALHDDHDRLLETSNTVDSSRAMEGATIRELGEQIQRLEADNARLKEDVAFFEAATADRRPAATKDAGGGIAIRRFQVTQDRTAHTARYRILLTQDSRANRDFTGDLQLAVTLLQGGRTVSILLPGETAQLPGGRAASGPAAVPGTGGGSFAVIFKSYKRIDGSFVVPADAVVRSVQARILERGVVRVQQAVTLVDS